MHFLVRVCLTTTILAVIANCQGARGGGGGFRGGGSSFRGAGYRTSGGSACKGSNCNRTTYIVVGVLGGVFGLIGVVFGTLYCYYRCQGRTSQSNTAFIASAASQKTAAYSKACFESGLWSTRYHQYHKWHGPDQMSLSFDRGTARVTGEGKDNVGTFAVDGVFSSETNRIALTKTYKLGTGNALENFGHKVTLQLDWNAAHSQFEGKWYVQTKKYRGDGNFELKFKHVAELPTENQNTDENVLLTISM